MRYDVRDLERALIIPERDSAIIAKWRELADNKATLAFCCSHRHAQRFASALKNAGISAEVYLSTTSGAARRQLFERHQFGEIKVLCAVDVLNEGADFPHLECLLFLRPTESKRVFVQQLGRGLRRFVGKSHCVVIDFIGNFRNACRIPEYHGLASEEEDAAATSLVGARTAKEVLNLPSGCRVQFDARVIDIFASQVLDPRNATRHNIGRILVYQFIKLARQLRRIPTRRDVRMYSVLDDRLYASVFGSWQAFEAVAPEFLARERNVAALLGSF
jgi:superfamily II DNA or RNA helicase